MFEEQYQSCPLVVQVVHGLREGALVPLENLLGLPLFIDPRPYSLDDRGSVCFPMGASLLEVEQHSDSLAHKESADPLQSIERGDVVVSGLEEVAPCVAPTASAFDASKVGDSVVVGGPIAEPHALESVEEGLGDDGMLGHRGLENSGFAVGVDPQVPRVSLAEVSDEDRKRRRIALKPRTLKELVAHGVDDVPCKRGAGDDVPGECGRAESDALSPGSSGLLVQGDVVSELIADDLTEEVVGHDPSRHDEVGAFRGIQTLPGMLEADARFNNRFLYVEVARHESHTLSGVRAEQAEGNATYWAGGAIETNVGRLDGCIGGHGAPDKAAALLLAFSTASGPGLALGHARRGILPFFLLVQPKPLLDFFEEGELVCRYEFFGLLSPQSPLEKGHLLRQFVVDLKDLPEHDTELIRVARELVRRGRSKYGSAGFGHEEI